MPELLVESVWDYPRPPVIEPVPQLIKIVFNAEVIVETWKALRVLETSHPPVYYVPPRVVKPGILHPVPGSTWCEWKGAASYFDVVLGDRVVSRAAWSYPDPLPAFLEIRDYVAFYAGRMDACFVGDEKVLPQAGNFYGGWITSNLTGPFKGVPGTQGW